MNIFYKTYQEFKDIKAANPLMAYGYEDKSLSGNPDYTKERLIIIPRNEFQVYHIYIYDPSDDWDDFETNYKAGATL